MTLFARHEALLADTAEVSPHSNNPIRVALIFAAGNFAQLARSEMCPTFGHSPSPDQVSSRGALIKLIAAYTDSILTAIGEEGALHSHGEIAAEDYKSVCADAVYNDSLAERFEAVASKMAEERRDAR